jgi:hypothetical protein
MALVLNIFLVFTTVVFVLVIAASASRPSFGDQEIAKSGEKWTDPDQPEVRKGLAPNLAPPSTLANQVVTEIAR